MGWPGDLAWPCGVAISRTSADGGVDSHARGRAQEGPLRRPHSLAHAHAWDKRWPAADRVHERPLARPLAPSAAPPRLSAHKPSLDAAACREESVQRPDAGHGPSRPPAVRQHCATGACCHNCRRPQVAPCSAHTTMVTARLLRRPSSSGRDRFAVCPPRQPSSPAALSPFRHVLCGKVSPARHG